MVQQLTVQKVRGQQVEIKPLNLFMRLTCIIHNRSEMRGHLNYEFSKQPPALFENGAMRKNTKSDFAKELKVSVEKLSAEALPNARYVVDGGHLIHSVLWSLSCTYMDVVINMSVLSSKTMDQILLCVLMDTLISVYQQR